ncbi:MAG TPA: hypothetical protein DCL35_04080 [Candidatus Omnitrophica bacterium]|nr:hypothetical protein [Candidatus Omnitrophota bacterium]
MEKPPYLFDKSLIFSHIPLFADLKPQERKLIFDSLEIVEVKRSEVVYRQGQPPDAFYCIVSGRVEIFIECPNGEETLEHIHRGKYFGFISLLTGEPHSVSARAVNDTVIARIAKEDFSAILKSIPRLAIELSQMLSRRLKRKDLHPKSIFESTIIGVYGGQKIDDDALLYSLALSFGLQSQTKKKVIAVHLSNAENLIGETLGVAPAGGFEAKDQFFHPDEVFKKITGTGKGFDMLRVFTGAQNPQLAPALVSLLTMLVNDYHYCVIHLPSGLGHDVFRVLAQCDLAHIVVEADAQAIKDSSNVLYMSGVWTDTEFKKKTKLIILEEERAHGKGPKLSCELEESLFHQPIFATLPPVGEGPLVLDEDFSGPYLKAIRRISRHIGEVLVGLALGSGSAMGLSHIGVLKILEQENIPVDIVAGSSMGALIGALWCSGYTAVEVEDIILANKEKKYLFGADDFTFPLRGLIRGRHIQRFLKRYLKDKTFCDIKRPFKIVACDVSSMRQVVFDSGRLVDAVMASISIPGVFEPYRIADNYYIDGGIIDPLPTDVLIESGAKKVISVNVLPSSDEIERTYEILNKKETEECASRPWWRRLISFSKSKTCAFLRPNIFDVIVSSVQSIEFSLAQISALSQSDLNLHPDMTAISWAAFDKAQELISRGEEEARLHLNELKDLLKRVD